MSRSRRSGKKEGNRSPNRSNWVGGIESYWVGTLNQFCVDQESVFQIKVKAFRISHHTAHLWISGWGCSGIPGMAPAGTLVASDAGGWAEACEHGSCRNEVHHCCAICEKRLCHVHWHSPCPHVDPPIDPPPTPPLEQQPPPLPPTLPPPDTGAAVEPPHSPSQSPGTGAAIGRSWSRHSPRPRRRLVRKTNLKDRRPHRHRHHHHSPPPPPPPLPSTTTTATTATRIYSLVRPRGDGLAVSIPVAVVLSSHCCG